MGIHGLTTFIEKNFKWGSIELPPGSKLVIDGNNVGSALYSKRIDWSHGGDYHEFYRTAKCFFNDLKRRAISPFVIFDGIDHEEIKFDEILRRKKDSCKTIQKCQNQGVYSGGFVKPLFAIPVFLDVVQDLGIEFCFADGEADPIVASLANHLNCPVLAADSDFFIFELKGGLIPYGSSVAGGKLKEGPLRFYHFEKFAAQFGFDVSLRFLIPTILGNDVLKPFHYHGVSIPKEVIKIILPEFDSEQKLMDCKPLYQRFLKAREAYTVIPQSLEELKSTTVFKPSAVPPWIMEKYRNGRFSKIMLDVLVTGRWLCPTVIDKIDAVSAWNIDGEKSRHRVCKRICGILTGKPDDLTLVIRSPGSTDFGKGKKIKPIPPTPNPDTFQLSDIADDKIMPLETRQEVLFYIMNIEKDTRVQEQLGKLPKEWMLPAIAAVYWFKESRDPAIEQRLVEALILCFLTCSKKYPFPPFKYTNPDLNVLHMFSRWQCVYSYVIALNQLMYEPFQYTSPAHLLSGELVQYYAKHSASRVPCGPTHSDELYQSLLQLVLSSRGSEEASWQPVTTAVPLPSRGQHGSGRAPPKPQAATPTPSQGHSHKSKAPKAAATKQQKLPSKKNPFEALADMPDTDL